MKNLKLVWSDDPKDKEKVEDRKDRPQSPKNQALSGSLDLTKAQFVVIFRLEKSGRGGKTVTVMDGFPKHETFLKDLTKELKNACGTGGTYKLENSLGVIEIQGDKRVQLKALLEKKGIKFKGM